MPIPIARTVDVHARRLRETLPAEAAALATIHQFGGKLRVNARP